MKYTEKFGDNAFITYEEDELLNDNWGCIKYPLMAFVLTVILGLGLILLDWICESL